MLKEHMPAAADDVLILMCGPKAMIDYACVQNLTAMGYTDDMMASFC
jgi:cytochrome-b5 reductase